MKAKIERLQFKCWMFWQDLSRNRTLVAINRVVFWWYYNRIPDHYRQWTILASIRIFAGAYKQLEREWQSEVKRADRLLNDVVEIERNFPEVIQKIRGKVAAVVALCLLSFHAPAQDLILQRAPGMVIFSWQGDTIDTNALPAMYRLFGCDSLCALQRTAALIVASGSMKRSDEIDFRLKVELGGIGLNQYRWLRDFLMMCAEDRKDWLGEKQDRK